MIRYGWLVWAVCLAWMSLGSALARADEKAPPYVDTLRSLATQAGGRIKPLDTYAIETVRSVTGKAEFEGHDAVQTLLSWWALGPDKVADLPVIEFRNQPWRKKLGLRSEGKYFTLRELANCTELAKVREQLHALPPDSKVPQELTPVAEVLGKMVTLQSVAQGSVPMVVPSPEGLNARWSSLFDLDAPEAKAVEPVAQARQSRDALRAALVSGADAEPAAQELSRSLRALGAYPADRELAREVHYNHFHPFQKAWILYLFSLICLFLVKDTGPLYWLGVGSATLGVSLHAYGFYLRCMIAGRAPVTNMYESVIWVAFGAVTFALIFEWLYRQRSYLMAACTGAVVCLVLADQLPAVLDPTIAPLTSVLRSNFWLTIHVLTITLGYAAFMLALGLGHMVVWRTAVVPDRKEEINALHAALNRAIQVGVLCLAAGTMLGGVWASYSWGRFWGWDPKEVWALIALLGYLAILHARFTGWIGPFGIACWSILAFQGVLMAWYGVNFVLGVGLHSYGFGTGGLQYVGTFSALEVLGVVLAAWKVRRRAAALR